MPGIYIQIFQNKVAAAGFWGNTQPPGEGEESSSPQDFLVQKNNELLVNALPKFMYDFPS